MSKTETGKPQRLWSVFSVLSFFAYSVVMLIDIEHIRIHQAYTYMQS